MQTETPDAPLTGIVYRKNLGQYDVFHNGTVMPCVPSGNLWKSFEVSHRPGGGQRVQNVREKQIDPVVVGDQVRFILSGDGRGMILEVLPRRNKLARQTAKPMPGAHAFEQVIAANLDQAVSVLSAANPAPRWHLLDRTLVTAESYDIPAVIVITKMDLVNEGPGQVELMDVVRRYREIGYPVFLTSAYTGEGMEALHQILKDRRSVFIGKSGVGKTSLLNALEPDLGLRVQAVNASSGKGRHTTTYLEMFPLAEGGAIIDTPGVREFGLYGLAPEDIAYFFPEMRELLGQCRFGLGCSHDEEPGCAIRQAVMDSRISPYRYKSYLRLKADM
jgi:ribosome biogenesis GTPase